MPARPFLHVRAALVVTAASVVLAGTTTWAVAEAGSDGDVLRACVLDGNGQLRLLMDPAATCRANESPVQWGAGGDGAAALAAFQSELKEPGTAVNDGDGLVDWTNLESVPPSVLDDGGLSAFMLSLAGERPSGGEPLVHWSNLTGVPGGLEDGVHPDDLLAKLMASHIAYDAVGSDQIGDKAVRTAELADGAVGSQQLQADSVTTKHLAGSDFPYVVGAVTSEKIADGTVQSRDLGLHVSSATGSGGTVASELVAPEPGASAGIGHADSVLVAATAQLTCMDCAAQSARVAYEVVRRHASGPWTPITGTYVTTLSAGRADEVVSLSLVDPGAPTGSATYALRFVNLDAATSTVQVAQPRVDALVL